MELNSKVVSSIASALGMKAEDITAKLTSEKEEDITLPEGEFFTKDQLSKRDKSKYEEGRTVGEEKPIRELRKEKGWEFEGASLENLLSYHENLMKEKYSKGSSDRVKELETDLEKQKQAFQTDIENLTTKNTQLENQFRAEQINGRLLGVMPTETTIDRNDVLTLYKANRKTIVEDGKEYVLDAQGNKLKDEKTQEPISVEDDFKTFVTERGYVKKSPGRGGGNEPGGNGGYNPKMTPGEFQEKWQKENPDKSVNSQEFSKDYQEFRAKQKENA